MGLHSQIKYMLQQAMSGLFGLWAIWLYPGRGFTVKNFVRSF
jgi:hypothetical protein